MIVGWVYAVVACDRSPDVGDPPNDDADSDADADSDSDTDADTDSDTALPCEAQPFEGVELGVTASFYDTEELDRTGKGLWVGDLDGDGVDEIVVGASTDWYTGTEVRSAVYLLEGSFVSGALPDLAALTVQGFDVDDDFGDAVVGLPAEGLIGASSHAPYLYDYPLYLYEAASRSVRSPDEWIARIFVPDMQGYPDRMADCAGVGGSGSLCLSGKAGTDDNELDLAGRTLIFDGPIEGTLAPEDARSELVGDAWNQAVILRSGADLDGDGRNDLLVGALQAGLGHGAIALVSDPPAGQQNLWSVAYATLAGSELDGELGLSVATGDLDGDGHTDVFGGAPLLGPGRAHVFLGPFVGERSGSEADVTVEGTLNGQWTGYSVGMADLDADGATDLAVAQPNGSDCEPARVVLFRGPLAGTYTDLDADLRIPAGGYDDFGFRMELGDVDGDTRADLLISAPYDDLGAPNAGAVHLVLGSSIE